MARILIVDDCVFVLRALELAVHRMGHETDITSDPIVALGAAMISPPDLLMLDFKMPTINGVTLVRELREALGDECPPVLFVSAVDGRDALTDLPPDVPVVGFVHKPFMLDELNAAVRESLASTICRTSAS